MSEQLQPLSRWYIGDADWSKARRGLIGWQNWGEASLARGRANVGRGALMSPVEICLAQQWLSQPCRTDGRSLVGRWGFWLSPGFLSSGSSTAETLRNCS